MSKVLFSKEKIMSLISDLNLSLDVVNINKFDKEVTIDLLIENFTHKSKSEAKNSIIKQLSSNFDSKLIYLLNFKPKVKNINDGTNKLNNHCYFICERWSREVYNYSKYCRYSFKNGI